MAFLRAFIDDSVAQKGDKRLFLAGYLHRADAWAHFSEVWENELRSWPAIEYFKGKEAHNLDGQFDRKRWDHPKRDAKIAKLAEIIRVFRPISFHFSLNRKLFEEVLKPVSPRGLSQPHFVVCFHVVAGLAQYAARCGINRQIEFIFDEQDGVSADIQLFFSHLKRSLPKEAQDLIEGVPWFKNDKDKRFMPLQAADMLAWHVRREHEYPDKKIAILSELLHPAGHLVGEIPDEAIHRWADHHSKLQGVPLLKSQQQWRDLKTEIQSLMDRGVDPSKINRPGFYPPESAPAIVRIAATVQRWLFNPCWPPRNKP